MVVAQLVERSPPTPEVPGSNQSSAKFILNIHLLQTVLKKRKKEKVAGNGPFFKKNLFSPLVTDP